MKTIFVFIQWGRKLTAILLTAFLLFSCEDFIDTPLPDSQLFGNDVFEDKATANAAMTGLYSKLRDQGLLTGGPGGISLTLGLYTDELDYFQSGMPNNFFSNSLFASDPTVRDIWNLSYNHVYVANAIIKGVTGSQNLPQADKNQLLGEAFLVRGLIHLHLVNIYGKIPYITGTDYRVNMNAGRLEIQEIYSQIISDFMHSAELLPDAYVSAGRTRPNRPAALALLARAYLYSGDWSL